MSEVGRGARVKAVIEKAKDSWLVKLSGDLDANADAPLQSLARDLKKSPALAFDLQGIGWINSAGARAWAVFLKQLTQGPRAIELTRCSPNFVDYLNLVQALGEGAEVTSFAVPLSCGGCKNSVSHVLRTEDAKPSGFDVLLVCGKCGGSLTPDVHWGEYLHFLSY